MKRIQNNRPIAVRFANVSKKYEIHHEKPTFVEKFVKGNNETFWALKQVSFSIYKGEKVGIIGPNGSGKTTLLKIISGITTPTSGRVQNYGKVVSLIDLEAGFHEDLTGIQNIYLNGSLLGMSHNQITKKLSSIIRFADIKQFIDAPLFTYSSGMKLRLGFAVAVHAEPDILVVDEHFSAGDSNFQQKSQKKMEEFFKQGKTILVVSHWLDFIKQHCNRVIYIRQGTIRQDGGKEVVRLYEQKTT